MTLTTRIVAGVIAASAVGGTTYVLLPEETQIGVRSFAGLETSGPTAVTWQCGPVAATEVTPASEACAPGPAQVCMTARSVYDPTHDYKTCQDVVFPLANNELIMQFANLPKRPYDVSAEVKYADGRYRRSWVQRLTGLGDTVVLFPGETQTIDVTPTPTGTPAPTGTPTPSSTPAPPVPCAATAQQFFDSARVMAATDAKGNQWSMAVRNQPGHVWLVTPDGTSNYSFPAYGAAPGAAANYFMLIDGVVYAEEAREPFRAGGFWRLDGRMLATQCAPPPTQTPQGTPTPLPSTTPTPTSTPSPSPTPTTTPSPTPTSTPSPTPTPTPIRTINVAARSCLVDLSGIKPAAATGLYWKVQYFDGSSALTNASDTVTRYGVSIKPGSRTIRAVWTRSGSATLQTSQVIECAVR